MAVSEGNRIRHRARLISRRVKQVILRPPERAALWMVRRWFLGAIYRWLFLSEDGKPHRAAEIVLADLRDEAGYGRASNFHPDPTVMAYREGKRASAQRIFNYLNLDEATVQYLMEIDDGLD